MRRLVHFVLPLLAFVAGLGTGAWFSGSRSAADSAAGAGPRSAEKPDAEKVAAAKNARAFSSDEEMLTAIMSAVAEEEPLLRAHRLHDLIGHLGAAELAVLFDRIVRVEDLERRGPVLGAVFARWAALDPAGAAAAVRPYRERYCAAAQHDWRGADTAVNAAWTEAQPDAALAEAMKTPDAPWAQETAWNALDSLANGDPAQKLALLARLPAGRQRGEMCEAVIKGLAETDPAASEASLELLTEPRQRTGLQAEILGKLAGRDAAAGLARLAALAPGLSAGTEGTRLVSNVLRAAAKKDPAAALAALADVPEELRTPALGAAQVGWADGHPAEALGWAAAHGVDVTEANAVVYFGSEELFNSLVGTAFESDRGKTLAWVRAQPASPARDDMLRDGLSRGTIEQRLEIYAEITPSGRSNVGGGVMQALYQDDPQRAEAWAKAQPAGAARQSAISNLGASQSFDALERRETFADAWPPGPDRDAALSGIVWSLNRDLPRALDFARRVGDSATREQVLESVARTWSYRDEPAARAWITSAPEFSAEQKRVLLRQFDER